MVAIAVIVGVVVMVVVVIVVVVVGPSSQCHSCLQKPYPVYFTRKVSCGSGSGSSISGGSGRAIGKGSGCGSGRSFILVSLSQNHTQCMLHAPVR